jgi:hypothetical protein
VDVIAILLFGWLVVFGFVRTKIMPEYLLEAGRLILVSSHWWA